MDDITELDNQIAGNVREFEVDALKRRRLNAAERDKLLTETLGAKTQPLSGEKFILGDSSAGVTEKSVWYQFRRIHFAAIISIAVGQVPQDERIEYCVDVNCTVRRSFRFKLSTIPETDNFLTALSQFMAIKVVPTIEDEMREQQRAEEALMANEIDIKRRQRRIEWLALRQTQLLSDLVQIECAPRVSFGVIY